MGGTALTVVVDRDLVAGGIEGGPIQVTLLSTELTEAEMLELVLAVVSWTGLGLVATGVGMALFAIAYLVRRRRGRKRVQEGDPTGTYGSHAVLGAVLTGVLSFLSFAPGIGGAIAGYVERGQSERTVSVGALAGLLAMAPALLVLLCSLGGVVDVLLGIGRSGLAVVVVAIILLVLLLVSTIGAGFGALGGYVGGKVAESRASGAIGESP